MHTAMFEMKMAHLSALNFTRMHTEAVGLTPARLDMLRALMAGWKTGMLQSTLRRKLCVSAPVVSIMVRAIEELGFVRRERCSDDRRTFVIWLTEKGEAALRQIYHDTVIEPFRDLKLQIAFGRKSAKRFAGKWEKAVFRLEGLISEFRREFCRGLNNPWEIDEDVDDPFYTADVPGNPMRERLVTKWNPLWGPTPPCYEADRPEEPPEPKRRSKIWDFVE
ncbi:hypothetical protein BH09MYX1_BH09MYX1_18520 [soil metagenome]